MASAQGRHRPRRSSRQQQSTHHYLTHPNIPDKNRPASSLANAGGHGPPPLLSPLPPAATDACTAPTHAAPIQAAPPVDVARDDKNTAAANDAASTVPRAARDCGDVAPFAVAASVGRRPGNAPRWKRKGEALRRDASGPADGQDAAEEADASAGYLKSKEV